MEARAGAEDKSKSNVTAAIAKRTYRRTTLIVATPESPKSSCDMQGTSIQLGQMDLLNGAHCEGRALVLFLTVTATIQQEVDRR